MDNELQAAFAKREANTITDLDCGIFLGQGAAAADPQIIKRHAITHILNVADDVPRANASAHLEYCCLEVGDFGTDSGISRVFSVALTFVSRALDADGNVLVHCANGSNRSPTIAVALLMMLNEWPLCTAYEHVASRRQINPLADNQRQLLAFEKSRHGGLCTMEMGAGGELVATMLPDDDDDPQHASAEEGEGSSGTAKDDLPRVREKFNSLSMLQAATAPACADTCERCDRCDKTDHKTEDCPFFSKPADAELKPGRVQYDAEARLYTFLCPHCNDVCTVQKNQIHCRTFRHAQLRPDARGGGRLRFLSMHAPQHECERWVREKLIFGCGKPFRFDGRTAIKCGYV